MLAELGCVVMRGGREKEGVHEWPVIESERAEGRCRIRGRDIGGSLECIQYDEAFLTKGNRLSSMRILYN